MAEYIALLRGINVGGSKPIKMDALRNEFESLGFERVRTVLTSGNVLFESKGTDRHAVTRQIKDKLEKTFGHDTSVILRTRREVFDLVDSNPFEHVKITPKTRLYVTFFMEKPRSQLKIQYKSPEQRFKILRVSPGEVYSTITLSPHAGTTELMKFIDKEFSRENTTRNWNTVIKIYDKMTA